MKKRMILTFIIMALLVSGLYIAKDPRQGSAIVAPIVESSYDVTMKQDILCLMLAYPGYIKDIEKTEERIYVLLKSGIKLKA